MIIMIANPKGGTGKTMLAHQLAFLFAYKEQRTAVVDLHNLESSDGIYFPLYFERRNRQLPYSFHIRPGKTIRGDIDRKLGRDFVLLDSVSGDLDAHHHAVSISDRVFVPVNCSPVSYNITARFLEPYAGDDRFAAVLIDFPCTEEHVEETRKDLEERLQIQVLFDSIPWSHMIDEAMGMCESLLKMPIFPFYSDRERFIPRRLLHLIECMCF